MRDPLDAETLAAKTAAKARLKWRAALRKKLPPVVTKPAQDPLFAYPGDLETRQERTAA